MNARKALVTFWVFLSLLFLFFSPLVVKISQKEEMLSCQTQRVLVVLVVFIKLANKHYSYVWDYK